MTRLSAPWLDAPATRRVVAALRDAGLGVWFVGGCVRNALLGQPVADIDIATDAPPDRVVAACGAAGLHVVPTGIDHGTVTVVADGTAFEVTTFRRDVETDGRRATVAFGTDLSSDAHRRDFTMNALYVTPEGEIVDPVGGLTDLHARRLRFIGSADARIREDYLRILRFFRFHAWYADTTQGFDPDALAAIAATLDGLDRLSRERVGAEMMKLLAAPDPAPEVAVMDRLGILAHVLPGADATALAPLVHFEAQTDLAPDAVRRLAVLGGDDPAERLRLSNADERRRATIRGAALDGAAPAETAYRHGAEAARDAALVRAALTGAPPDAGTPAAIARGADARFPLRAADLMPAYAGPALGKELARLEQAFIASDFTLDRAALLSLAGRG
ncbi:CCA tRNA nucleotidyltransferase [Palleronia sp. KMU-117]|uniref:CCA tRNA nucleotidyltransferase n=1 Tax=Palleronia sp. KMU-117 TaxID=3434108 RepID=UPI003D74606C